ncbi:MAG: RCC1 domain-containing protein, partial [Planctomycetota bacterium]
SRANSVVGWGDQVVGVDLSNGFVEVAAGARHSLGLKQDGSIAAWGYNGYGQCTVPSPNGDFIAIEVGTFHCLTAR